MPDITDAEFKQFVRYQSLGTPEEAEKKIRDLETDNKGYRDKVRDLEAAKPADGSVVLPKERAQALEAYEKLGKPEELANAASERDTLRQKDQQRTRQDSIKAAVAAVGWNTDTVATIEEIASLQGAKFEVEATKNDKGEDVRTAYITPAGEGATRQKFTDFASGHPALKGLRTEAKKEEPAGAPYPKQPASGSPPGEAKSLVEQQIEANKKAATAPNALRPAAPK